MVQIEERLLPKGEQGNRPGTPLSPIGLVIHTTANPGADAEVHYRYWSSGYRASSAHIVVDWGRALTLIPWQPGRAEVAWHAGPQANKRFLGLEICESNDPVQAQRAMENAAEVAAQVLRAWGWGTERLIAHAQVAWWLGGTDHQDPLPYLARWNRTWADFVAAVDRALRGLPAVAPAPQPAKPQPVAVLDAGGRRLAEGWLHDGSTVVRLRDLADGMGLIVDWDPGGPAVTLRWPGRRS
nr:MAG: hypothetical protein DIU70_06660 [Bacillota bacterium]